jgi:hypothetical protein
MKETTLMKRHLKTLTLAIALSVTGLAAFAQHAPWERPRPENMTAAHEAQADAAIKVLRAASSQKLGVNGAEGPHNVNWRWQSGRNRKTPVSNIDLANYNRMVIGRYFIRESLNGKTWDAVGLAGHSHCYRIAAYFCKEISGTAANAIQGIPSDVPPINDGAGSTHFSM